MTADGDFYFTISVGSSAELIARCPGYWVNCLIVPDSAQQEPSVLAVPFGKSALLLRALGWFVTAIA